MTMSMNIARKLLQDLLADEALAEAFTEDPEAFLAAGGYDCTYDELREAKTLDRKLDENELDVVTGGGADGKGGCTNIYYQQNCAATVEEGSHCWSNDYCPVFASKYTKPNAKKKRTDLYPHIMG